MKTLLVQEIAETLSTRCIAPGKSDAILKHLCDKFLPHEAGIGFIAIDPTISTPKRIVINVECHHKSTLDYYDGYFTHKVIVTPSFITKADIRITGSNLNDIKERLYERFEIALTATLCKNDWYRGFQRKR